MFLKTITAMNTNNTQPHKFEQRLKNPAKRSALPINSYLELDEPLLSDLSELAETIQLSHSYREGLEERLIQKAKEYQVKTRFSKRPIWHFMKEGSVNVTKFKQVRLSYAIGFAALTMLILVAAMPVAAQSFLEHFIPREIVGLPTISGPVDVSTISEDELFENIADLQEKAGFDFVLPTELPAGCRFWDGTYLSAPISEAHLYYRSGKYSYCFSVYLQKADKVQRPFVREGSFEEVSINEQPGLYFRGTWDIQSYGSKKDMPKSFSISPGESITEALQKATEADRIETVWTKDHHELAFEQDGLLIRLLANSNISKKQLIEIAESME